MWPPALACLHQPLVTPPFLHADSCLSGFSGQCGGPAAACAALPPLPHIPPEPALAAPAARDCLPCRPPHLIKSMPHPRILKAHRIANSTLNVNDSIFRQGSSRSTRRRPHRPATAGPLPFLPQGSPPAGDSRPRAGVRSVERQPPCGLQVGQQRGAAEAESISCPPEQVCEARRLGWCKQTTQAPSCSSRC